MLNLFLLLIMWDMSDTRKATEELLKLERAKLAPTPPVIVPPAPDPAIYWKNFQREQQSEQRRSIRFTDAFFKFSMCALGVAALLWLFTFVKFLVSFF
jgi:hypothetical protein